MSEEAFPLEVEMDDLVVAVLLLLGNEAFPLVADGVEPLPVDVGFLFVIGDEVVGRGLLLVVVKAWPVCLVDCAPGIGSHIAIGPMPWISKDASHCGAVEVML